jgi:hypothetical protein
MQLVRLAERSAIGASPLAFGEGGMKKRAKNVMNFKKHSRLIAIAAAALVLALSVGLAVNQSSGAKEGLFADLLPLRTPYVGDSRAVRKIVDAMPLLGKGYTQLSYTIGSDYGTGSAPYTMTVYYKHDGKTNSNYAFTAKNAVILFALIDDLEEVNIDIRHTPSEDAMYESEHASRNIHNRNELGAFLWIKNELTWGDFHVDWKGSIEKAFALFELTESESLRIERDYYSDYYKQK